MGGGGLRGAMRLGALGASLGSALLRAAALDSGSVLRGLRERDWEAAPGTALPGSTEHPNREPDAGDSPRTHVGSSGRENSLMV